MTTPNETSRTGDACERRIVRAGFQGREGSFGARAAARCGRPVPLETFDALLAALAAGEVDEALLPAVDRVIGPVDEALSALVRAVDGGLAVAVLAEVEVPMRLVLAAPRGVALEEISEVVSQPPVLRQCEGLLARLGAAVIAAEDTAEAAGRVAALGGRRAAVCSEEAALEAGLVPLLEDVSDLKPNGTRFWRLARQAAPPAAGPAPRVLRVTDRAARGSPPAVGRRGPPGGGRSPPSRSCRRPSSRRSRPRSASRRRRGRSGSAPRPTSPAVRGSRRSRARPTFSRRRSSPSADSASAAEPAR